MQIIALDISSTHIGWVRADEQGVQEVGTEHLLGSIEERILQAYTFLGGDLFPYWRTDIVYVEAPAVCFPKGAIPQLRVNGAIMLAARQLGIRWVEVTPTQAKHALTGSGRAKKGAMLRATAQILGYTHRAIDISRTRGAWRLFVDGDIEVCDEHAADALGVYLAGRLL